ncbi:hypothetical protein CRG98_030465 [Punica granatum]|uniref:Uncharacterized protein n=1 Tax=Punica granatum TaxID=22663 RepID=A0A2I0IYN2_PUNGR|nr:hypothetical protein CRG98_030465 [Punica granatum]
MLEWTVQVTPREAGSSLGTLEGRFTGRGGGVARRISSRGSNRTTTVVARGAREHGQASATSNSDYGDAQAWKTSTPAARKELELERKREEELAALLCNAVRPQIEFESREVSGDADGDVELVAEEGGVRKRGKGGVHSTLLCQSRKSRKSRKYRIVTSSTSEIF